MNKEIIRLPVAGLVPEAQGTDLSQIRFPVQRALLAGQKGHPLGMFEMAQFLFIIDQVQDQLVDVLIAGASGCGTGHRSWNGSGKNSAAPNCADHPDGSVHWNEPGPLPTHFHFEADASR